MRVLASAIWLVNLVLYTAVEIVFCKRKKISASVLAVGLWRGLLFSQTEGE